MNKKFISVVAICTMLINSIAVMKVVNAEGGIVISGTPYYNHTLTASGAEDVKWYISNTADGVYKEVASGAEYTLDVSAVGKWIKAGSGEVYSTPVKDTTITEVVYSEDFNDKTSLGSEWTLPEDGIALSNNCLMGHKTNNTATLKLPTKVSGFDTATEYIGAGNKLVFDMTFSYCNSIGANVYLSQGDKNGSHMIIGKDAKGTDRLWIVNTAQTAYENVVSSEGGEPGDGKLHNIRLDIDLATLATRSINVSYDGITSPFTTAYGRKSGYGQAELTQVDFVFGGSDETRGEPLYIDSVSLYKIKPLPENLPTVSNVVVINNRDSLSVSYDITEGGNAKIEWYASDSVDGTYTLVPNAESDVFDMAIHENRYIKACVVPLNEAGESGAGVESEPVLWSWLRISYIDESFSAGTFDAAHFWNTKGLTCENGTLSAAAKQESQLVMHVADSEITTGKMIIEMKINQTSGTDGFDFDVNGASPNQDRGMAMGILFSNGFYITAEEAQTVGTMKSYASDLANNEWHTLKYLVDFDNEKRVSVMMDGNQIAYSGNYFAGGLQNPRFTFKDNVTVELDDIKVYSIAHEPDAQPITGFGVKSLKTVADGDKTYASVDVANGSGENKDITLILAEYEGAALMKTVITNLIVVSDGKVTTYTTDEGMSTVSGRTYKAFVWDSLAGMKPVQIETD